MSFRYLADSLKIVTHRGVVISFPIFLFSTITCSDGVMSNTYCVVFWFVCLRLVYYILPVSYV